MATVHEGRLPPLRAVACERFIAARLANPMSNSDNPYRSPATLEFCDVSQPREPIDKLAFALWPIVFTVNLIVPTLFGLQLTRDHGRVGVLIALFGFLTTGWLFCFVKPKAARALIFGSVLIALSQIYPLIHILSGSIALSITTRVNLAVAGDDSQLAHVASETGGFLITLLTGLILLACAAATGSMFALVLPPSAFRRASERCKRPTGGSALY